jgi:disulfide bond formation protein DsbB
MGSLVHALAHPRNAALLLLAASVLALAAALTAQYVGGLEPCPLCLYQRVPYVVGGVLAAAALVVRRPGPLALLLALAAAAFFVNTWIAFYHVGVENNLWTSAVCTGDAPAITSVEDLRKALAAPPPKPCDAVEWTLLGISMAGYNVIVSSGLAGLAFVAAARARWGDPRP